MSSPRWTSRIPTRSPGRAVAAAAAAPVLTTLLALALPHHGAASAASLYLVGVVAAAVVGGMRSGVAAAILSFVGLNYFFTEPFHTLKVRQAEDLVALAVFLVVASVVAALVARVLQERDRAERSTAEARSLASFTGRLLSNEPIERSLEAAARTLVQLFDLSSCRIAAEVAGDRYDVDARGNGGAGGDGDGPAVEVPLAVGPRSVGSLVATRGAGHQLFTEAEQASLRAFAGQVAMALQRTSYDAEIRAARLEAEASDLRAALFSSITHDLRTPLASITASVSSLLDADAVHDAGQREELLRTSLEEANRLNRLVGNLLDLARMRAGALTPASQLMPVEEVVEAVVGRLAPALKGVRLRTFIRDELPLVSIDPIQIDQVLTNLLENAIRFSPPGRELRVAVHRMGSRVEVRVADDGPGIPPEDRERVFEPFFKRDTRSGRGGTGLGLAIARAIVLAHDGRIWIEGTPTGGTAVVFQLPVPAQPAPKLRHEPPERAATEVP